ncbi:MAG: hypothetical protein IPL21_00120 [Saprospirales bacterium]|nr:hypothetical protein [Saprospirales bacterium]
MVHHYHEAFYGSWTISESGCLTYKSNNLPGNNVDTICVKTVDAELVKLIQQSSSSQSHQEEA